MSKTNKSITEQELLQVPLPEQTETYTVISHEFAINKVRAALALAGFEVVGETYRANSDGTVARGVYHIEQGDDPEMQMMFSWVNSYDKSTKFQCGVGAVSTTNGSYMLTKDMTNFIRKHTGATALEDVETVIAEQVSKADAFFVELIRDKQAMCGTMVDPQKYGELLGRMYVNAGIITTQQISAIKQEFESPSYNYTTPEYSLWTLYNHILSIIKLSHPKNFFKQLTVIHSIVQTEFDLFNFDFTFDEEPVEETDGVETITAEVNEEDDEEENLSIEIDQTSHLETPETYTEEIERVITEQAELDKITPEDIAAAEVLEEPDSIFIGLDDVKEWNPELESIDEGITVKLGTNDYTVIELVTDNDGTICEIKPLVSITEESSQDPEIQCTPAAEAPEIVEEKAPIEATEVKEEPVAQPGLFDAVQESSATPAVEKPDLDFSLEPEETVAEPTVDLSAAAGSHTVEEMPAVIEMVAEKIEEVKVAEPVVEAYVEDPAITAILAKELEELLGEKQDFTYTLDGANFMITMADQSIIELDAEYISMLQDA